MKHYAPNICLSLKKIALLYQLPKLGKGDSSAKYEAIHSIYRILLKVNQVIYILDIICMPNIMIEAQEVLQIFC